MKPPQKTPTLILLSGMPRSGSTWALRILNEICVASGGEDYQAIRSRYCLDKWMTAGSALIELAPMRLVPVLRPLIGGHTFTVKTHVCPFAQPAGGISHRLLNRLNAAGRLKVIYLFRDPRDAVLSGFEYGQRSLQAEKPNAFADTYSSIDAGIEWMSKYLNVCWKYWREFPGALILRYEDLLTQFTTQSGRIVHLLGLDSQPVKVAPIPEKYCPGAPPQVGTHYYKGEIGRFRQEFSPEQQQRCQALFVSYLQEMGYPAE